MIQQTNPYTSTLAPLDLVVVVVVVVVDDVSDDVIDDVVDDDDDGIGVLVDDEFTIFYIFYK